MKAPNRKLRFFLILFAVSSMVSYYVIEFAYPRYKFKHTLYQKVRNNPTFKDVSDEKIDLCVDCTYEGLIERYGKVKYFPNKPSSIPYDYKLGLTCAAKYLYNEEDREFCLKNMDSIVKSKFNGTE